MGIQPGVLKLMFSPRITSVKLETMNNLDILEFCESRKEEIEEDDNLRVFLKVHQKMNQVIHILPAQDQILRMKGSQMRVKVIEDANVLF